MEEKELHSLFLSILGRGLRGEALTPGEKEALTPSVLLALYRLSKSHDLAHILSAVFSGEEISLEDDLAAAYQKQEMLSIYRTRRIDCEVERIGQVLADAGIAYIPLKGAVIRPLYPIPSMRTSCDIDILVPEAELHRAANLLVERCGYEKGGQGDHDIAMNAPNGVHFELHYSLIEGDVRVDRILSRAWEYAAPEGEYRYAFFNDFLLFYHLAHAAKHFNHGGCGIRPFMDLYVLEEKLGIVPETAQSLLEEAELLPFAIAAYDLMHAWFAGGEGNDLTDRMQTYLMNAGVYGNEKNLEIVSQNKQGGKVGALLCRIFLTYLQMCVYYPSLKKFPPLFPIYQVRRWFRIAFRKDGIKSSVHKIKVNQSVTDEQRSRVGELLKDLHI